MTSEAAHAITAVASEMKDHDLVADRIRVTMSKGVRYEKPPVENGKPVCGLYDACITLDNPTRFNPYTTDMVKGVILVFPAASAAGDKAFCTGGNSETRREVDCIGFRRPPAENTPLSDELSCSMQPKAPTS
jgi:hypothetical protein